MAMENYNPPQDPWLVILYQDEHIMVVNKPSGLLSVPGRLEEHKDSVMTRIQRDFPLTSNGTRTWRWKTTIRRRIPGW